MCENGFFSSGKEEILIASQMIEQRNSLYEVRSHWETPKKRNFA